MIRKHSYASTEPQPGGHKPEQGVKGGPTPLDPMGSPVPGYCATPAQTPSESPGAPKNYDYGPHAMRKK